jgi:hypothetical protein
MFISIGEVKFEGFIDADWVCDTNIKRSTVGYAF